MTAIDRLTDEDPDFRRQATFLVALSALLLVVPFTVVNFLNLRIGLGAGSLSIVALLVLNAWRCHRDRYSSNVVLFVLVPPTIFFLSYSLRTQGVIGLLWCYPALLSFHCMLSERHAQLSSAALVLVVSPTLMTVIEREVALRGIVTLLATGLFATILVRVITRQQRQLRDKVVTDALTGLLNRHALAPVLERSRALAADGGIPMTLLALDIDHFRAVNDDHGHEVGDMALVRFGTLLRRHARSGDSVFRLRGDEFLVLLDGTDGRDARRLAETLCAATRESELLAGRTITTSIGLATHEADRCWQDWMRRADSALYRAKGGGRDRVVVDPPAS